MYWLNFYCWVDHLELWWISRTLAVHTAGKLGLCKYCMNRNCYCLCY